AKLAFATESVLFGLEKWKWSSMTAQATRPGAAIPDGAVLYAIGDMHGQIDLVHALLQEIIDRFKVAQTPRRIIVGLGDYVDRGPDSAEVIEMLISVNRYARVETHFLRGNHEQAMLDFLENPETGAAWSRFGGGDTLTSYGVTRSAGANGEDWEDARRQLLRAMPAEHLEFLKGLPTSFSLGGYFFAH